MVAWLEPPSRSLWTSVFYESGEMDRPIRWLKSVDWDVTPPQGVQIFVAAGARSIGELGVAWVGWHGQGEVIAVSLLWEAPIAIPLPDAARVVAPAWVDAQGHFHLLAWLQEGICWALVEHIVDAPAAGPPRVEIRSHGAVIGEPMLGRLLVVPGEDSVVLGWVEAHESGLSACLGALDGELRTVARVAMPGSVAVRQRLGLTRGPDGALRLAFVATD